MIVGYCLAVAQVAVHYKKLNKEKVLQYLPTIISILSEYLISGSHRVRTGAFTGIKNLLHYTLEYDHFKEDGVKNESKIEDLDFDLLTIRDSNTKIHPVKKIVFMLKYCLNKRFENCYTEVLKLINTFIEIGGKRTVEFGGVELLQTVGNLQIKKPSYKCWIECQGKFLDKYKSELFFETLPMKLLDYDLNSESYSFDSRSYMIPVIQKHVKKESLHFFVDNFMPLIDLLTAAKKDIKKENQFVKLKKYETLICQIWEVLPNYCYNYSSFKFTDTTFLVKILSKLDKIIEKNLYSARVVAFKNLCTLIDFFKTAPKENLLIKKARVLMMKKSIGYINNLSLKYLNTADAQSKNPTLSDVKEQEHTDILRLISKFGWAAKRANLYDLFFNELTNIVQEFTDFETQGETINSMEVDIDKKVANQDRELTKKKILRKIDIIICLMERIKLSKRHCELIITFADSISKSKITQKKAFRILSIILTNYEVASYQELKEMFSKLTGYAFNATQQKQKLVMLRIFLSKIRKPKKETDEMDEDIDENENVADDSDEEDQEEEMKKVEISDEERAELANTILPEIITGFTSLQSKSNKVSEMLLMDLVQLHCNHFNEFLKKLLAGFAGDRADTRSATISILTKVLRKYKTEFSEENLGKIAMIILLFLNEDYTRLQKCVLKCLKKVISLLRNNKVAELSVPILKELTTFEGRTRHNVYVKYIIKRLIKRLGKEEVKKLIPEEHVALVDYVDKMMRREVRQKAKELLIQDEEEKERERLMEGERVDEVIDSDDSSDSSSDSEDDLGNRDTQMVDYDIPIVRHLKVSDLILTFRKLITMIKMQPRRTKLILIPE